MLSEVVLDGHLTGACKCAIGMRVVPYLGWLTIVIVIKDTLLRSLVCVALLLVVSGISYPVLAEDPLYVYTVQLIVGETTYSDTVYFYEEGWQSVTLGGVTRWVGTAEAGAAPYTKEKNRCWCEINESWGKHAGYCPENPPCESTCTLRSGPN